MQVKIGVAVNWLAAAVVIDVVGLVLIGVVLLKM